MMKRLSFRLFFPIISCQSGGGVNDKVIDEPQKEVMEDVDHVDVKDAPKREEYIDESIAAHLSLRNPAKDEVSHPNTVFVIDADEKYELQTYEGSLMKASGAEGGFNLKLVPFHDYDYNLEMEIRSKYDEDLLVYITKEQNESLGYVNYDKSTNNLHWDYLENLFQVYYYQKEGKNIPTRFINKGKTDWDG
ncbi:hypothetical protein K6119_09085 [Paracrocinitomix mangrovi]|uniref:hypothetical protein n=1 Tax=Paracrocinitomix mangrovi TaxID=2862509 RepID=UPI001EDC60A0|nr:hypothetical protein [Paracrocinitomix mangrovi]UKN03666.1 hypothetical protein K6119_09085 [Paracrocinitomix mangrovi]